MSYEYDLRLLAEMADEITTYRVTGLPGALRSLIKTKRGIKVAELLELQAYRLVEEELCYTQRIEDLTKEIDGLRNENQQLSDSLLNYLMRHES